MMVSVITPSFNKVKYVGDAIASVLMQKFTDFEYVIVENSTDAETREFVKKQAETDNRIKYFERDYTEEFRKEQYVTAVINNEFYPKLEGKYMIFLSDDDILMPSCLGVMVDFLEQNPDKQIAYHTQAIMKERPDGEFERISTNYCADIRGFDSIYNSQVDCMIDGGQIMHTTACLKEIEQPYFPTDMDSAAHCDGVFMEKLAKKFTFYPVHVITPLSIHRRVSQSAWVKPTDS